VLPWLCLIITIIIMATTNTAASSTTEEFEKAGHSAFVLGYTGEVGKELVKVRNG